MRCRERELVRMLLVLLRMDCRIPTNAALCRETVGKVVDVSLSLSHFRENSIHHLLNCLHGR